MKISSKDMTIYLKVHTLLNEAAERQLDKELRELEEKLKESKEKECQN